MTLPSSFTPGARLPADDLNRLLDSARKFEGLKGSGLKVSVNAAGASVGIPQSRRTVVEAALVIKALNDGESALLPYAPCGISGHVQEGEDAEFNRFLKVRTPTEDDESFFAITAEPIPAGEVGRVYVVGVCLCRLKNSGDPGEFRFAEIEAESDYLVAGATGGAQILWEDTYEDDDVHLALVRFPRGGDTVQDWADCVSVANRALTGTPIIDGISSGEKYVLLVNQSVVTQVGLYFVSAEGEWTFLGQPKRCDVLSGTNHGGGAWRLKATNDYDTCLSYWG